MEDIPCGWVINAEDVWEVSRWPRVFHKMAQETGETIQEFEIEGFKVFYFLLSSFLFLLAYFAIYCFLLLFFVLFNSQQPSP